MAYPTDLARTKNWGTEILTDADLEGQYDLIINWVMAAMDESTGHSHDGTENEGPNIDLESAVTGTLPVTNGGTGQATLADFLNLIYPVGSIYMNASDDTNPGTLLGFGTWEAIGVGKVLLGVDSEDEDFDTAGNTGGAKTADLSHTHTIATREEAGDASDYVQVSGTDLVNEGGDEYDKTVATTATSSAGSATQSILNPYEVVYMWERTA